MDAVEHKEDIAVDCIAVTLTDFLGQHEFPAPPATGATDCMQRSPPTASRTGVERRYGQFYLVRPYSQPSRLPRRTSGMLRRSAWSPGRRHSICLDRSLTFWSRVQSSPAPLLPWRWH